MTRKYKNNNILRVSCAVLFSISLTLSIAGMEIALFIGLIQLLISHFALKEKALWKKEYLNIFLLFFIIIIFSSIKNSEKFVSSVEGFLEARFLLSILILTNVFKKLDVLKMTLFTTGIVSIIVSLLGVIQAFTGYVLRDWNIIKYPVGDFFRVQGFFSNTMTYSYSMGILVMFSLGFCLSEFNSNGMKNIKKIYRLYFILITTGMTSLCFSLTRGVWLSVICCVLVMFFLIKDKMIKLTISSLLIGVILLFSQVPELGNRFKSIWAESNSSRSVRLDLWRANFEMILDNPLLGVGWRKQVQLLPGYFEKLGIEQKFVGHAHNNLIEIFSSIGVIGGIVYLIFSYKLMIYSWNKYKSYKYGVEKNFMFGITFGQLMFHLGGLTEATILDYEVLYMFCFFIAIIPVVNKSYTIGNKLIF